MALLGADAIGLNFYPHSPRAVAVAQIHDILENLPVFTTVVGLLVNPSEAEVHAVLDTRLVDCLQFHGDETQEFCQSFGVPYLKAIRVKEFVQAKERLDEFGDCAAIILDTYVEGEPGGTGQQFDWSIADRLVAEFDKQIILAGGLDAANVGTALTNVKPYGVDVSSGVEAQPGIKDPAKLQDFFRAVYQQGN